MLRRLFFLVIVALVCSCAKPPHLEMDAAEYMIDRARQKQALDFAPTEYHSAQTALSDARRSMQDKDYGDARESLEFALKHARRAVILAEEGATRRAEEEAKRVQEMEQARQTILKAQTEEVAQPPQKAAPAPKPVPKSEPKISPVNNYTVVGGETLWTISAQPQVYNDGLLWPLLYQANRDQIKDPRQIFPGQVLSIRRDVTEKDLEDTRQKARESDIFPVSEAAPKKQ